MRLIALLAIPALFFATQGHANSDAEGQRTAQLLGDLIRIDTTNPPGDTRPLAQHLKRIFDAAGIPNEIILAPNGKAAHFIARLNGDGGKRPILLAAHSDVVPADRSRWSVDPFAGTVKDGYIYGRGALDNKGAVAAFARALLRIKADRLRLARDIIFLVEADEEQGQFNTNWLAEHHWDKIDAEFSLNEGGSIRWVGGVVSEVSVSNADKLTVNLRLRAEGPAGHSSRPFARGVSANDRLVAALAKLTAYREPIALTAESRGYLDNLAVAQPALKQPVSRLLAAATPGDRSRAADELIAASNEGSAWGVEGILRNTIALTMLQSGLKPNIIPGVAEATLNARLMPGTNLDEFLARLRNVVAQEGVVLSVLEGEARASQIRERSRITPSRLDTELYRAIEESAKTTWPRARVIPTLLVASTDATPWRKRGVPVYGISPFPTEGADARGVHGDDERVSLRAITEGTDFVYRLIVSAAAK